MTNIEQILKKSGIVLKGSLVKHLAGLGAKELDMMVRAIQAIRPLIEENKMKNFREILSEAKGTMIYDEIAQAVFDAFEDLKKEKDVLDAGFAIMKKKNGIKDAQHYFNIDDDFPADFISAYRDLQRGKK